MVKPFGPCIYYSWGKWDNSTKHGEKGDVKWGTSPW